MDQINFIRKLVMFLIGNLRESKTARYEMPSTTNNEKRLDGISCNLIVKENIMTT